LSDSLEERLLALVNASNYRANKPRVLAKRLDLTTEERVDLRRLIKKLVKAGKLEYGKNHLVYPKVATTIPETAATPETTTTAETEPGPKSAAGRSFLLTIDKSKRSLL